MNKFIAMLRQLLGFDNDMNSFATANGFSFPVETKQKKQNPNIMLKGGKGGGGTVVEKPVYVPPPAAPAVQMAATQDEAITPEEEAKRKQESTKLGTKSLQIPITTASGSGQVGTGAGERTGAAQA